MSDRQPALRPTEPATLVAAGLGTAALAWVLVSNAYQQLPPMSWPPVVLLLLLAAGEVVVARALWARIHSRRRARADRRPQPPPFDPLLVARFAVLAKATSLAGAIFTGWYLGLLPWLAVESGRLVDAADDLPPTVGGLVASVALTAAALWLERACRVPPEDDESEGRQPPRPDRERSTDE